MESSGKEQNYWPGFVDALSNVVLTLVFVLVVFVFALVMASGKVEKKAYQIRLAAMEQEKELAEVAELKEELVLTKAELEDIKQKRSAPPKKAEEALIDVENGTKTKGASTVAMSAQGDTIALTYPPSAFLLNKESLEKLDKNIEAIKPKSGAYEIILRATVGKESYSIAQRMAYYRAMSLRNHLMSLGLGIEVEIKSQIIKTEDPQDGRVEIIFRKK